ncbi:MAG: S4 domain-containing protein YaaA [Lactobacillus sp.]|jgi:S4 domain protein YaaA|uniref:S4 domain-containing protein YaaA n=1 Tax=Lacticaseibacillus suilingensis TaxID=2799577 RepID=A0ABW4BGW8_9LACO|nr:MULTISPECIES: S4 domain-containing protein YaaA [Lacticaseibacillus]MCI1894048.1 S4 domain-containing protein YaaA [Lactobacillus sp.]MCI1917163.1 S4 domain-containing protein YaaA [Lactobacillus sp.]MCI1942019.1 S4 domain-containing protein YaaA [Lactobacillus sp.]MCI1972374.1 S4 domain-containing protein YaaA [Lactobacillus sp.]MCI2016732.1 S4 domain-containing protein YaaA [Lactobacillus sp.]
MTTVPITTAFITLGQLLKDAGVIDSGGAAKHFLRENRVLVNQTPEDRRGRKLEAGDVVQLEDGTTLTVERA